MIGFLDTYYLEEAPNSYQKEYGEIFERFLSKHFPGKTIKKYQVALGEFPSGVNECEVWFIGGSSKSSYDEDPWIARLSQFIKDAHAAKVKMVGFCFGHQLIAQALGGKVEKSLNGWGVGVRSFKVLQPSAGIPDQQELHLIYSHQDQVTQLPQGSILLGSSDFCPYEMFAIEDHVICFQGHPEFTTEFALGRYQAREKLLGPKAYQQALETIKNPTDAPSIWQNLITWVG